MSSPLVRTRAHCAGNSSGCTVHGESRRRSGIPTAKGARHSRIEKAPCWPPQSHSAGVATGKGLLGVHALRTFGDVVFVRHRDGSVDAPVDWVRPTVAFKGKGDTAETQLTLDKDGKLLIARTLLAEGQLAVHHDATFFHYVTPLVSGSPSGERRDCGHYYSTRLRVSAEDALVLSD